MMVPNVSANVIFQFASPVSAPSLMPLPSTSCHFIPVIVLGFTVSSSILIDDVAGDQVCPPSRLNSRKTSKKLPNFGTVGDSRKEVPPLEGNVGLPRILMLPFTVTSPPSGCKFNESISV